MSDKNEKLARDAVRGVTFWGYTELECPVERSVFPFSSGAAALAFAQMGGLDHDEIDIWHREPTDEEMNLIEFGAYTALEGHRG